MENTKKSAERNQQNVADTEFKGYTIEELRYQRALIALQREFCKEKLLMEFSSLTNRSASGNKGKSKIPFLSTSGMFNRIFKSLDYIDYLMMGISAFTGIRRIARFFKKNKQ